MMTKQNLDYIQQKYWDIIKEEVNVKNISSFPSDINIKKIYKPVWKSISEKFGKDTGQIINFAKTWNVQVLENWQIKVSSPNSERVLEKWDYEVVYEGIDETNMSVEEWIVVRLDLEITKDLKDEGIIREISRAINQLRKDANYNVDDRINLFFESEVQDLIELVLNYSDFLKKEALITKIENKSISDADIDSEFVTETGTIKLYLKK